jgi:predicted nucleic acid-binding protein
VIAIDTNVLVRLVVADDAAQARRAKRLVEKSQVSVPTTVLLEAEWVLRSAYGFAPAEIALALRRFLGLPNVSPDAPGVVAQALDAYEAGLDFADALHLASGPRISAFYTFDRRLSKAARGIGVTVAMVPD